MPLAPGASFNLVNPRSCLGGEAGAEDGSVMYSWATSAPATSPLLATVAVTVATVSQRSSRPPGTVAPVAAPDLAVDVTAMLEKVKLVYAVVSG